MLIYDIEIVKAIQKKDQPKLEGIEYCEGFHDHANAGVSVICVYDWEIGRYRVFTAECFSEFERLAKYRQVAGFNSMAFDDAGLLRLRLAYMSPPNMICYGSVG